MVYTTTIWIVSTLIGLTHGVFEANKCLSTNAFYNDTSLGCQCDDGYKGLGDLCCDDTAEWSNCNIGGDPWLSSYDGTSFRYNWPCVSRVAVASGTTGSGNQCTVEVMASSTMVEKGAQYPDRIAVSFTIEDGERQTFKFFGNTLQRPGDTEPFQASDLYRLRRNRMRISGERFNIGFVSSRHIWTVTGCDAKVTFRAAQDKSAVQYNRPGVCFSLPKSSGVQPTGQVNGGDICSVTSGYGGVDRQFLLYRVMTDVLNDYVNLGNDITGMHPEYLTTCNSLIDEAFVKDCKARPFGVQSALQKCSSILYSAPIKMCLTILDATGPQMLDMMLNCIKFQCEDAVLVCRAYLESSKMLKICVPDFCRL